MSTLDTDTVVSVESNGRVLSGVGADSADLEAVMERHAPAAVKEPANPPAPNASAVTPEPVKESKGRQRFSELANERKAAEARATAAEQERDALKAKLDAAPASVAPPVIAQAAQQQQQAPRRQEPMTRQKPTEDQIGTTYQSYAEFVEDLSDWKAEQRIGNVDGRIRQSIENDRQARSFMDHVNATHEKGRAAYADFDTVYRSGPGGQVPMPMDRLHAIYQAPNSEHLQYAVMKDAALAQKLASISPIEFGMELAKLTTANPTETAAAAKSVVQPPAPYQPVGANSKTVVAASGDLAKQGFDFDRSGYREKRAAERKSRRQ